MADADVNDPNPSRRSIIMSRLVERIANISGMAGASHDKPYTGYAADELPHTWVIDAEESYDVISTGHYDCTLRIVTWTQFEWDETTTCRTVGERILKAMLICVPGFETDPTLGVDDNGAPLLFTLLPEASVIEPSGDTGNIGICKCAFVANYIQDIADPSAQ